MGRDLYSNIRVANAIAPAVQAETTEGAAIDLKGVGRMAFILNTGAVVGSGNFYAKVQESDSAGDNYVDATAGLVDSDAPATLEAASSYRISYRGFKRYVRLVLTKESGTSIAAGAVAVLTDLRERPQI